MESQYAQNRVRSWSTAWKIFQAYPDDLQYVIASYIRENGFTDTRPLLDIGCGRSPISDCFYQVMKTPPQRILLDLVPEVHELTRTMHGQNIVMEADLESLLHDAELQQFLEEKIREADYNHDGKLGTIVASNILNYVDYRNVLKGLDRFVGEKGTFFVGNIVDWGIKHYSFGSWEKRPRTNEELVDFFENKLQYELINHGVINEETQFYFIIAQKPGQK